MIHNFCKFFILLFLSLDLFAQVDPLYQKIRQASEEKNRINEITRAWNAAFLYIKNANPNSVPNDIKYRKIRTFLKLSTSEKTELLQRIPKIQQLEAMLAPGSFDKRSSEINQTFEEARLVINNEVHGVQNFFKKYHEYNTFINSEFIDSLLPILKKQYDEAEKSIIGSEYKQEMYIGWPKNFTQSHYEVLRKVLKTYPPKKNDIIYDLGSGYGRFLFYGASIFPENKFIGIEIVPERASFAKNIISQRGFKNVTQVTRDVLKADYTNGTYFYLFNSFQGIMPQVMKQLHKISLKHKIVIISLGNSSLDLAKQKWLVKKERILSTAGNEMYFNDLMFFESKQI